MARKIESFTDLETWQEAHSFAVVVYKATEKFPEKEKYGLTNQLRRSAASIASNIAEGFTRQSIKEKIQFYSIAKGSVAESQSHLLLARDVGYLSDIDYQVLANHSVRVYKLTNAITTSVKKWSQPNTKSQIPKASVKEKV